MRNQILCLLISVHSVKPLLIRSTLISYTTCHLLDLTCKCFSNLVYYAQRHTYFKSQKSITAPANRSPSPSAINYTRSIEYLSTQIMTQSINNPGSCYPLAQTLLGPSLPSSKKLCLTPRKEIQVRKIFKDLHVCALLKHIRNSKRDKISSPRPFYSCT